jgi:hypothetical protein
MLVASMDTDTHVECAVDHTSSNNGHQGFKKHLHPKKPLPTVFTKNCENLKIDRFSVQNSIFKIWEKKTKNRAGFLIY